MLLVAGAGVRANIFLAPVETTIVKYLSDNGYDVWLESWRASIDLEPNQWTLDKAAIYDHPQAVAQVIELTGAKTIKALIHCQGSTSFMMAMVAGLIPQVDTVVSNAVSLHPVVPLLSKIKISLSAWPIRLLSMLAKNPKTLFTKALRFVVHLLHKECDNTVCKHASFINGSGHPTLWRHENLNKETHEWLSDEFGFVPTRFFTQIGRGIRAGELLAVDNFPQLPKNFVKAKPNTSARFAFFCGKENVCFLPESQKRSFEHFDKIRPNYHSLNIVENYGHLCMFMGKNAYKDVFPLMLAELDGKPQ